MMASLTALARAAQGQIEDILQGDSPVRHSFPYHRWICLETPQIAQLHDPDVPALTSVL